MVSAAIPVNGPRVQVTSIITEIGQTKPKVWEVDVTGGLLRTQLTEYPIFIEATVPRK